MRPARQQYRGISAQQFAVEEVSPEAAERADRTQGNTERSMSVSGEGVNFQSSEVLALTYEFRRIFSLRSRGIFIWCTFLGKTNKILRHISAIFDPRNIDKIPYVW